ncbi:kelch-like protein 20 [Stylophora pistillata]|nr:kelch-like protein 20 [Stylophora pistillata]
MITSLKDLCAQVILRGMSLSNCIPAYFLSVKYQCEELKKGARVFILENFVTVAKTEDFLSLSKEQFLGWISSDEINVRGEEEVFIILRNWIAANKSQEQNFYELFRHIRFMYLPRDFFLEALVPDPMVKNNLDCSNFALNAMRMMFRGELESFFAQAPRNCLKTHEDAIVACGARRTVCYIPLTKKWYRLANTLTLRNLYGQNVSYCQGKLFFIGGNSGGFPAEFYDPSQNKWCSLKSFKKRIKFCTVSTCRGFLYVIGGVDEDENLLSSVQRYDPDKDLWQEMPSLSFPRSSVCAVSDGSFLYAVGGNTIHGFVAIAERFDPKEKTWARISPTLEKRGGAVGAAVSEKVFVFGGLKWSGVSVSTFAEMYDPVVDKWSSIPSPAFLALRLRWLSAISFKGTIFVSGECADDTQGTILKLHIYDSITKQWVYCCRFPDIVDNFRISCLRIPREILNSCEVASET